MKRIEAHETDSPATQEESVSSWANPLHPPVVVFPGAGVSTASGIPDFRSQGGLWDTFDPMEFTIQRFHEDPARFWERRAAYITAARHPDAQPNAGHLALARATAD